MSLTSLLKTPSNPTRLYLEKNFPSKKNFIREWERMIKDLPSILPESPSSSYPWSLVGHAINYRICLFFQKYYIKDTVAASGLGLFPEREKKHLWNELEKEFEDVTMNIVGEMKSLDIETRIAKCCIALSYFEVQFRSGQSSEALSSSKSLDDLFKSIQQNVIDDLVCLFQAFFESDNPFPAKEDIVLDPTFSGSRDVGGADGDIIIDHVLWDFKSTQNPIQFKALFWPYQLIGYALLDYYDLYSLTGCGIYLVRQARWFSWSFEELFSLLESDPEIDISAHRECFSNSIRNSAFSNLESILPNQAHLPSAPIDVQKEMGINEEKEALMHQIRGLRTAHGLTLREMADRLKVPEKEWKRIFNGNLRSSPVQILKDYVVRMKSWTKQEK